jgi:hypothetical protein
MLGVYEGRWRRGMGTGVLRNAPVPMYGRGRRVIEKVNYKGGEIPRITSS